MILKGNLNETRASKRSAKHISVSLYAKSGYLSLGLYDFAGRAFTGGKVMSLQVNALN